ncbi:MAG: DUF438 domain-containing protein [Prevotella sp.]|nr:DUF438 domain-containing protein [Prevotella sp.]MDY4217467.1 DUF438 domain-containing protein [Prevotella sp.]
MANKMKNHLPKIELEKLEHLLDIKEKYGRGEINIEEARTLLNEKVGTLKPYHYAFMEQTMTEEDPDECFREDMSKINELLSGLMDNERPALPADHPLTHYYRENDELRRILLAAEDLVQYPVIKNQWLEIFDALRQYPIHYVRKQNQLYPILEKKGFNRPTTTMWNFDDLIRDEIKEARQMLDGDEEVFIEKVTELITYARDLMLKEETILYPTSLALITKEEFEDMKRGDQEIGFAFFDVEPAEKTETTTTAAPTNHDLAADLQALLAKHGYNVGSSEQVLDVATGKLTLEQINLIYKHLPIDISFVDENEIVKFYSDTDHRIFPRSKNVIGREVSNCHPRKSVHIVKEIVEKFRSGEQDKAEFWINKPEVFIYIVYFAVRDKDGNFRGVLEMMQDCTHIRSLMGSQTLLTWAEKEGATSMSIAETATEETSADSTHLSETLIEAPIQLTADTRLRDLFDRYPALKKELARQYPSFKMLNTPLGKLILKKATIATAGERSGLGTEKLIALIQKSIERMGAERLPRDA